MTVRALLAILVLALLSRGLFRDVFLFAASTDDTRMHLAWLAQVFSFAFLFWMPVLLYKLRPTGLIRLTGPAPSVRHVLTAVFHGLVLLAFAWSENAVETLVAAQFNRELAYSIWAFHADAAPGAYRPGDLVAIALRLVVLAPVVEEFFFRALLIPALRKTKSIHAAAIFSSCLFTLLHYPKLYLVSSLVFAFALAYLYMASGSLLLCIAIHSSFNAGVFIMEYAAWPVLARTADQLHQAGEWAVELVVFVVSSAILLRAFHRYRPAVSKLDRHGGGAVQNRSYSAR